MRPFPRVLWIALALVLLPCGRSNGQEETEGEVRQRRALEQADRFEAAHGTRDLRDVHRRAAETGERELDAERRAAGQRERSLGTAAAPPEWTALGPAFNPSFASPIGSAKTGQDDTGMITAIAPHPTDPKTIIVGTAGGGLWRTKDGGGIWKAVADNLPAGGLNIGAVAYAPSDPTRVYAGSACGDSSTTRIGRPADALVKTGLGFLVSRDGGDTWSRIPAVPADFFWAISVDPANANTLLAGGDRGIHRSTDGGATWKGVLVQQSGARLYATALSRCTSAPRTVYAGVYFPGESVERTGRVPGSVYKSTDGGETWASKSEGWPGALDQRGRAQVAAAPTDPDRVYVLIADLNNKQVDMAVSRDGGDRWTALGLGSRTPVVDILSEQGNFANVVAVDPKSADTVWAGGLNLWRSTDAGATFAQASDWSPPSKDSKIPYTHADQHALVWGTDGALYAGNDGGIYRRADDGSWASLNKGIVSWIVDELCVSPDASVIMNGAQDNGTSIRVSGTDWLQIGGGDGSGCLVHPTDKRNLVISTVQQGIEVSKDGGKSFSDASGLSDAGTKNAAWRTFLLQDPTNSSRVFTYSKKMVWVSTDGGANWSKAASKMPLTEEIVDLAITPDGSRMLFADGKTVYESTDFGGTWTRKGETPVGSVSAVRPDPTNSRRIFVTSEILDAQKERVWESTDGGSNWTPLSRTNQATGLPDLPVFSFEQDPRNPSVLWAGAFSGLYRSDNGGRTWQRHGTGLPNVPVSSIRFSGGGANVLVGTSGRGVWQASSAASVVAAPPAPSAGTAPAADFTFAPAAPRPGQAVRFADASTFMTSWSWDFGDGAGTSTQVNPSHVFVQPGTYTVALTVSDGSQTSTKRKSVTVALGGTGTGDLLTYLLPAIVRSDGQGGTQFGTELTLTNRSGSDLSLVFRASTIHGSASSTLRPGQEVHADVFDFLSAHGLAVPPGPVVTPLRVEVRGAAGTGLFGAQVRVTTPPNDALRAQGIGGRFGLAFPATPLLQGATSEAYLYGLQQTSAAGQPGARSNVACVNAGSGSNGAITLEVTYRDASTGLADPGKDFLTLEAFQFAQVGTPLASRGIARGFAQVRRVGGDDQFVCYATVIDNVTGDGAFVPMAVTDARSPANEAMMPVVLDTGGYRSEMTISNRSFGKVSGEFALIPSGSNDPQYGDFELDPLSEVTIPDLMAELRSEGFDAPAGTVASMLFSFVTGASRTGGPGPEVNPEDVSVSDVNVSVRTYASKGGGTFGLAYPATAVGASADTEAWVFGLQQSGTRGQAGGTRSNLGLVHAVGGQEENLVLEVTYFDSSARELGRDQVTLVPGQWTQIGTPLARYAGVSSGYARIRRVAGTDQFLAYGVLNDQANDDGSFVPMIVP